MFAVFIFNFFFFCVSVFLFTRSLLCVSNNERYYGIFRVGSFVRNLRSLKIRIGNSIDVNVELYSMTCKRRENQLPYFIVIAQVCFGNVHKFLNYRFNGKNSLKVDTVFFIEIC